MESNKLPKSFKKKWLKALRSGKYKQQDEGVLRTPENKYCCLGVAAHLVGCTWITGYGYIEKRSGIRGISKIPKILIGYEGIPDTLAQMNDSGKSFEQIADWIEINL